MNELAASTNLRCLDRATGDQPCGNAGTGRLDRHRKHIVGAGRQRDQDRIGPGLRDDTVSAVTAQRDDDIAAFVAGRPDRSGRVGG